MESQSPLISVIIPTYNAEKYIAEAIESVKKQTYENWELIIVNDASPDNSLEVINNFIDEEKIKLLNLSENKGRAGALNEGIKNSKGKFICILDADDVYLEDKLDFQVKTMNENQDIDALYGSTRKIGEDADSKVHPIMENDENLLNNMKDSFDKTIEELKIIGEEGKSPIFNMSGRIASCSPMIKREVFEKCGFDENLKNIEDYDMWYQIAGNGFKISGINRVFYLYRQHDNQKSKIPERVKIATEYIFEKFKRGDYFKPLTPILKN